MRIFAQKPKETQQTKAKKPAKLGRMFYGQNSDVHSILHLQRTIGNHAAQRLLQSNTEDRKASPVSNASTGFVHDFSRIPVHAKAHAEIQPKSTVSTPGDIHAQETDGVADRVFRMPEPKVQQQFELEDEAEEDVQTKPLITRSVQRQAEKEEEKEIFQAKEIPGQTTEVKTDVHARMIAMQGRGQYSPGTAEGRRLLAHELTHTIHQAEAGPALQRQEDVGGSPEGTTPCSGAQRRVVRQALGDAKRALSFARRAVVRGDTAAPLQNFFGESNDGYATLVERLEAMHDSLQGRLSGDELLCTEDCADHTNAYTTPDNAYIVLCPQFFSEDTTHQHRVSTLVHESVHTVLDSHTDIYRGEPIYDRLDEIATGRESSGSAALQNPDSIAAFVLTVASGRWPELAPEEDEAPVSHEWHGFEGETGAVEQTAFEWALVWARQWLHWAGKDIQEMLSGGGSKAWRRGTREKLRRYALFIGAKQRRTQLLDAEMRMEKPLVVARVSENEDGSPASWTFKLKRGEDKPKVEHTVRAADAFFSASSTESRVGMLLEALRRTDDGNWPSRLFDYVIDNAQRHIQHEDLAIDSE